MKYSIFFLISIIFASANAQTGKVNRANEAYENYAYIDAISTYEELIEQGLSEQEVFANLGDANYVNARYETAAQWYAKLLEAGSEEINPEYFYRHAQSLRSIGDYEESAKWMEKFSASLPQDQRAINYTSQPNFLEKISNDSGQFSLTLAAINSEVSDFAPAFADGGIIFSTARDTGIVSRNIHEWNNGAFLNLYRSELTEDGSLADPKPLGRAINTKAHESSAVLSPDGNTLYFTRNNSAEGRFKRDAKGISRLKLFRSIKQDDKWTKAEELPFNGAGFSTAHPAVSPDGKYLYFSSDMPGTLGASDIFRVEIKSNGSFGEPENLGNPVNTEARESFPFIHNDILYFSSDGHPGLGGLDVFAYRLDGSSKEILNLAEPLNSPQDDFSFILNDKESGYIASNRTGGIGGDDIYSFVQNSPLVFSCSATIEGIVKDRETDTPLKQAKILLMHEAEVVYETESAADGSFQIPADCNLESFSLLASSEGYDDYSESIVVTRGEPTEVVLTLPRNVSATLLPESDLIAHLNLKPINFDLDSAVIRQDAAETLDQVADFLKKYPGYRISVASHTDSKASNAYNNALSQKRAKSTYDYLLNRGIAADRMRYKGFGEDQLLNDCEDWSECSDQENERNRRSEIIVVQ